MAFMIMTKTVAVKISVMKKLFSLLFIVILQLSSQAQSIIQTTVDGWNTLVTLPADYNSTTVNYPALIFIPGTGEVGTNIALLYNAGPHAFISQGGSIPGFIVVSLQPTSAWPRPNTMYQKLEDLLTRYRIDPERINVTGLSMGAWCWWMFACFKPAPNSYFRFIKSIINVEGVEPSDAGNGYGYTLPYAERCADYASRGGISLGFEQVNDYRGMQNINYAMNTAVPGSHQLLYTNFGGGVHCCWESFYGGKGVQPGKFLVSGKMQTMYDWLATINTLSITPIDTTTKPPVFRPKMEFWFDAGNIYFKPSMSMKWIISNMAGQTLQSGSSRPGNNKIPIEFLRPGVYVFRTEFRTYKFLK